MTLSQFIRNNRGINGGGDIDQAFLTSLYNHIKDEEIQVSMEASTVADDVRKLDGLLERAEGGGQVFYEVDAVSGVHEKDMWYSISQKCRKSLLTTAARSKDDVVVSRCADGWYMYAHVCQHHQEIDGFNELLLQSCRSAGEFVRNMSTIKIASQTRRSLIRRVDEQTATAERGVMIYAAAEHRSLLALVNAVTLTAKFTTILDKGWSGLLELLFLLRNHGALPDSLGAVEDFADLDGSKLPNSPFRERAESRAKEYLQQLNQDANADGSSWWGAIWGSDATPPEDDTADDSFEEQGEPASADPAPNAPPAPPPSFPHKNLTTSEFVRELVSLAQLDGAFPTSELFYPPPPPR
jgi:brefeldin A-resistance guanine nucleotide exchange factor 1